jgi:hypothetical protein
MEKDDFKVVELKYVSQKTMENIELNVINKSEIPVLKSNKETLKEFGLKRKLLECVYDWADETTMVKKKSL